MKCSILVSGVLLLPAAISLAIVDSNNNGLSDLWEKAHNNGQIFPETYDSEADPDQDGWTNAQEAAAGTDPNNANAPNGIVAPEITHIPAVMGEVNGQPVIISPDVVTVSWLTLVGKRYALHFSPDLSSGSWLEVPQSEFIGDGDIHEFNFETSGGAKCFWRVAVTDVDSENDGLTDAEEHALNTDPQDGDSDDDNLPDGEEITIGSDPNNQYTDEDNLADGVDALPNDTLVDWERTSEGSYLLMDIPVPANQTPRDINDNGDILFDSGIWMDGTWCELEAPEMSGGFVREQNEEGNTTYESNAMIWTAFNNDRQLVGMSECTSTFTPDPGSTAGGGESTFYSTISWTDISQAQYCEELAIHLPLAMRSGSFNPLGVATDGRKAAVVSYVEDMNPDPEIDELKDRTKLVILPPNGGAPEFLSPPDDYLIHNNISIDRRVTASGWIICPSYKTTTPDPEGEPVTSRRVDIWKPDNTRVDVSGHFSNQELQRLNLTELPNGRIGITGGIENSAGGKVLLEDAGHSMAESSNLSSKGIHAMAGDGSAITRDHQLWRNGKLTPMRELCERYGDLLDSGWQLLPLKANKHGTYLIQAEGPNGEKVAMQATPANLSISSSDSPYTVIPDNKEESVGAFTVANLNNQDGDALIDNVDTSVKAQGGVGENEEDLMMFKVEGPRDGQVKVNVLGGQLRFWEQSTKETEYPMQNGAIVISGANLPKILYIEATTKSQSVRDIVLELSHIASDGTVQGGLDRVKATAVWAEKRSHRNSSGAGLWTTTHAPVFKNAFADIIGQWGINFNPPANDPNHGFHYSIGIEFEICPSGIFKEPGVKFDVARDRAFRDWLVTKTPPLVTASYTPGADDVIDPADQADDDDLPDNDEDVTGVGNRIYVLDGPGHRVDSKIADSIVSRNNFEEWVRVSFNGIRPSGNNKTGSRCSDKFKWHAQYEVEWDAATSKYKQKANSPNDVGDNHIQLGVAPSP